MSTVESQMARRRALEVVGVVFVLTASATTTWVLLREVAPALAGPSPLVGLLLVLAVDVAVGIALRGYGHLQLALSSGSNLVVEAMVLGSLAGVVR